ncbi:hypothetical protein K469DRAFT_635649 [Zopfia rhizophila CBS 207.26]|uniref:SnoaL-like domain-containing protein n=1 Tax=Zopfia rhizophila CBS 207.26 TaxID=1314779 RepID=A0A6A6DWK0_9PEZI|nr:hypothetical protein K469DRAFT_635649 [Zopfia rhizophila CBS 207.26]
MPVPFDVAEIISRKKAQYGRCIDTKQWHNFNQVALSDTEFNFLDPDGSIIMAGKTRLTFPSSKAFTEFFGRFFRNAETLHMFGPGELEQVAPDEVTAIWGMEDQLLLKSTAGLVELRGGGYYYETWKLKDGDWFLKSLRLERTYTKMSFMARVLQLLHIYLWLILV